MTLLIIRIIVCELNLCILPILIQPIKGQIIPVEGVNAH